MSAHPESAITRTRSEVPERTVASAERSRTDRRAVRALVRRRRSSAGPGVATTLGVYAPFVEESDKDAAAKLGTLLTKTRRAPARKRSGRTAKTTTDA